MLSKKTVGGTNELALQYAQLLKSYPDLNIELSVVYINSTSAARVSSTVSSLNELADQVIDLNHVSKRTSPRTIFGLRSNLSILRPDVIHTFLEPADLYTRLARVTLKRHARLVGTLVSTRPDRRSFVESLIDSMGDHLRNDAWIAVGRTVARENVKGGLEPERIKVVYPPLSNVRRAQGPGSDVDDKGKVVKEDSLRIIAVGRLVTSKGFTDIIRAMAYLPSRFQLVIAGDGPDRNALEREAIAIGVGDRTEFMGRIPRAMDVISGGDIYATATRFEGLVGFTTLEAISARVPVVAPRLAEIEEVFSDRDLYFYESYEPSDIAATIVKASLQGSATRVEHAYNTLLSTFDVERILADLLDAYKLV